MPRQDKTGPMGMGPGTGRGMGLCRGGMGAGRRRFYAMTGDEKKELVKSEIEDLKQELQLAEEELKELEK